jgi:hypothetical protein
VIPTVSGQIPKKAVYKNLAKVTICQNEKKMKINLQK